MGTRLKVVRLFVEPPYKKKIRKIVLDADIVIDAGGAIIKHSNGDLIGRPAWAALLAEAVEVGEDALGAAA